MNDEVYYGLVVYVNGEEDTVYLSAEDVDRFEGNNDGTALTGAWTKGFYEMQFVDVDSVKTVKILKGPAGSNYTTIDGDLNTKQTIVALTDTWVALSRENNKEVTKDFADDCAFYYIADDNTKVLEKVTFEQFKDAFDYNDEKVTDAEGKAIAYVSYNDDGDVEALYIVLNATY